MDDEFVAERTLCQLPSCHVFQIPRLANATGHRAADWPKDPVWTGKVKITAKGQKATIFLLDANTNANFATCHVEEGAVERVTDSGRYFVLKITNAQGKHAFIGIAFNERNDAFDFNVSLQEHKNECDRENQAATEDPFSHPVSTTNYKLEEGKKIHVKIAGKTGGRPRPTGGGGGGMLAPPKERHSGGSGLLAPPPTKQAPSASSNTSSVFGFDNGFGQSLPSTSQQQQQPPPSSDPFGSFSSDPFASSSASGSGSSDPFGGFSTAPTAQTQSQPSSNSSSGTPNLLDF